MYSREVLNTNYQYEIYFEPLTGHQIGGGFITTGCRKLSTALGRSFDLGMNELAINQSFDPDTVNVDLNL